MYKKTILDNGLRIISCHMPKMQSAALGLWIKVGGRYESLKNKGVSHYLEHLAFKGSKSYSCRKIKELIEGVGGSLNGFTSEEMTCYLAKFPSRYLDLVLGILADMTINPLLSTADIKKERTVILEEIKMYKDLPQSYVYELLDALLWPGHPLGETITGTSESVGQMKRKELLGFKERHYVSSNIVVSVAGLFAPSRFVSKVQKIFSPLKEKDIRAFPPVREGHVGPQLEVFDKDTEQTHLALGFRSLKREHPLRHALGLLHVILGGNMSSRLFNEVREKRGLAYEIGTQVKRFHDTGAFIVHAGIDNRKVNEAIGLILQELEKIKDKLVSSDEFRRAKDFYVGQLMLALEDTLDHMLWIGESTVTLDKIYTLADIIREVSRVGREDIRSVAKDVLKEESLNLALIGPLKDKQEKIRRQLVLS
jgi:predicted Zn-dependent peptidase